MTADRRFEQRPARPPGASSRPGPTPDYRDDIVQQTARTRQRPAWTFPERWLPMAAVTSRAVRAPHGSRGGSSVWSPSSSSLWPSSARARRGSQRHGCRRHSVRPPTGTSSTPQNGDIFTADPVTGVATAVVTGPTTDLAPVFSRDGTHGSSSSGRPRAARVGVDSSPPGPMARELIAVTPEPVPGLDSYAFSPDGREIAFTSQDGPDAFAKLWIAKADGGGVRAVDVGMAQAAAPVYRPTDGTEILFLGADADEANGLNGLYAINVESGAVRTIVPPYTDGLAGAVVPPQIDEPAWSPDGSRISYSKWQYDPGGPTNIRVHIVAADGTGDRLLPAPPGAMWDASAIWSNDGTRLAIVRGYSTQDQNAVLAAVPADGTGLGVETERGLALINVSHEWAPDDTSILSRPLDAADRPQAQLLWDPATGSSSPAPWRATSKPTWQRRAP